MSSRIPFDDMWDFHVLVSKFPCLCCKQNIMIRDDHSTWNRGHIIHHACGGADILENVRPICLECNKNDTKKQGFPDSYAYMVKIGTMTEEERHLRLAQIRSVNPEAAKSVDCIAIQKNGLKCTNSRKPFSNKCGTHGSTIRNDCMNLLLQDYIAHKQTYKHLLSVGELEDAKEVEKMMNETKSMYRLIM